MTPARQFATEAERTLHYAVRGIEIAIETKNTDSARQQLERFPDAFPDKDGYNAIHELYVDNIRPDQGHFAPLLLDTLSVYRSRSRKGSN